MKLLRKIFIFLFLLLFILIIAVFLKLTNQQKLKSVPENKKDILIKSPVFAEGEMIPKKYTCQGEDVSPPLTIENIPQETKSLVLIVDDPDAPNKVFSHWLVWNIDPKITTIKEGKKPTGAVEGKNDFGKIGYNGPCPPFGTHRYYFKIYALDTVLNLLPETKKEALEKAMENHILAQGMLMGRFSRL